MGGPQEPFATLEIYGLRAGLFGDWHEVLEDLRLDFAWFEAPSGEQLDVCVRVEQRAPDVDAYGHVPSKLVTPRNVVYEQNGTRIVDYFGRAVSLVEGSGSSVRIQGESRQLVHEAGYQFLLSRAGEHLDALGRPRLHALGLAGVQGGVAVMLPSGGGKSTLALRALRADGVRLISEDTPLIDRRGRLHPFPLRIGISPTDAERLPHNHVRRIERMEFHPKLVLELAAFQDRIQASSMPLRHVVLGRRSLGREARLEPAATRAAAGAMLREAVVGVGVYQGMEFVLQRGARDALAKLGVARTRALCCAAGLRGAKVWELTLGRDHEANWAALEPLLR